MSYRSLRDFLEKLASAGQLVRIDKPIDPRLEIAEITRRVAAGGGPALLFEQVRGAAFPVVTNLLGTIDRLCLALEMPAPSDLTRVGEEVLAALYGQFGWHRRTGVSKPPEVATRLVKQAPSQQVVRIGRDIDLATLPALQCWPGETGPTLWGRLIYDDRDRRISGVLCRAQVIDRDHLALLDDDWMSLLAPTSGIFSPATMHGLTFVPGGLAGDLLPACCGLEASTDVVAQHLRGKADLEVTKSKTSDLLVPASAEMLIEGRLEDHSLDTRLDALEPLGRQSIVNPRCAVMRVTTLSHRSGAMLNTFVHGAGDGELATLHQALEFLLTPFVRTVISGLAALALPVVDGWQRCAVLALRGGSDSAFRAASAFWGLSWTRPAKLVVLVDADVDVHDWPSVMGAIGANVDFGRDVAFQARPEDPTDPGQAAIGSRAMAIDATRKRNRGNVSEPASMPDEICRAIDERWRELHLPNPGGRRSAG
jgi:4-hydroxy-3-polyprenylbenzoate decarboxylase